MVYPSLSLSSAIRCPYRGGASPNQQKKHIQPEVSISSSSGINIPSSSLGWENMFDTFKVMFFFGCPTATHPKVSAVFRASPKSVPKLVKLSNSVWNAWLTNRRRGKSWFERSMDIFKWLKHHGKSWNFMINPWETEWKLGILDEFPYQIDLFMSRWRVIFPLFSIFGGCSPHRWLPLHSWSPRHLP